MNLTGKQYGIILFTLTTAFLHLSLFPRLGPDPIALNSLGHLALLGCTVLTLVLWVILFSMRSLLADKPKS